MLSGRQTSESPVRAAGYPSRCLGTSGFFRTCMLTLCLLLIPMPDLLAQSQERLLIINDSFPLEIDLEIGRFGTGRLYFDDPMDLSVNEDGDVFILDAGNYRIQVMDEDGDFLRKWNLRESSKEGFDEPVAMAMSYDEDFLVVLDADEGEVRRYDLEGDFLNSFGESGTRKGLWTSRWTLPLIPWDMSMCSTGQDARCLSFTGRAPLWKSGEKGDGATRILMIPFPSPTRMS